LVNSKDDDDIDGRIKVKYHPQCRWMSVSQAAGSLSLTWWRT